MFYCEGCRVDNDWPRSVRESRCNCEVCKDNGMCYDVPSNQLPRKSVPTVRYTKVKYVCLDCCPKNAKNEPIGQRPAYMDFCADCGRHSRGYVIESKRTVAAGNFVATLAVNVDNEHMTDTQFRELVRNTLPIVSYDGAEK